MRELNSLTRSSLLLTASARAVLFSSALPREMFSFKASSSSGVGALSLEGSYTPTGMGRNGGAGGGLVGADSMQVRLEPVCEDNYGGNTEVVCGRLFVVKTSQCCANHIHDTASSQKIHSSKACQWKSLSNTSYFRRIHLSKKWCT